MESIQIKDFLQYRFLSNVKYAPDGKNDVEGGVCRRKKAQLKRDYAFVVFEGPPPEENGLSAPRSGVETATGCGVRLRYTL